MQVITIRNVNYALPAGIRLLRDFGHRRSSRNGDVVVASTPVTTCYLRPWERVLFSPERDANPFFHLVEAVWMLAGKDDVKTVSRYVKRMETFSDDGVSLWGAYGYRWRKYFSHDQVLWAITRLKTDRHDRRVVIGMWDPKGDPNIADFNGKDVPCNTHAYVWIDHEDLLCMTVCCRSNDMLWGAYGANAVHFSVLQEFIAWAVGKPMGPLWQVSNNFHAYVDVLEKHKDLTPWGGTYHIPTHPMGGSSNPTDFLEQCEVLLSSTTDAELYRPRSEWLRDTVRPMMLAHAAYKRREWNNAFSWTDRVRAPDWRRAGRGWLVRRHSAFLRAQDDGVNYD